MRPWIMFVFEHAIVDALSFSSLDEAAVHYGHSTREPLIGYLHAAIDWALGVVLAPLDVCAHIAYLLLAFLAFIFHFHAIAALVIYIVTSIIVFVVSGQVFPPSAESFPWYL